MHRALFILVGTLVVCSAGAAVQQPATSAKTAGKDVHLLPGTRANVLGTIQGTALNSTNGVLADVPVRLRDVRFGRIVDTTVTDKAGLFAFHSVEPGSYVVELVGNDSSILAASQILNVDSGAAVSALVKLPFKFPPFGGLFGHTAASAIAVSTAAAAAGVLGVKVSNCVSPPCQ